MIPFPGGNYGNDDWNVAAGALRSRTTVSTMTGCRIGQHAAQGRNAVHGSEPKPAQSGQRGVRSAEHAADGIEAMRC
jgi:hypothetical protein